VGFEWASWPGFAIAVGAAVLIEAVLIGLTWLAGRVLRRLRPLFEAGSRVPRRRLLVLVAIVLLDLVVATTWPLESSRGVLSHALLIVAIAAGAWFLAGVVTAFVGRIISRYPVDIADNRNARRIRTQMAVLRQLAIVVIWLLAAGAAIFTIPGAQVVGTSLLASAGLASVIAGIAAQSVLGNVFAGVQLAFSGAIRVDDVVIANGEWGRIEEITLTYVVVRIWDERRLVLPSTYFTTNPFENWTRNTARLLGTVQLDVDWRVSPAAMRAKLDDALEGTPLWDGRVKGLIVEDATGGLVRMRALVSAANSSNLFDLRCHVREQLVEWVVAQAPESVPAQRIVVEPGS